MIGRNLLKYHLKKVVKRNTFVKTLSTDKPKKQNLNALFNTFNDHWSPKIAGEINDMHFKLCYKMILNE